jgi:hypothetical protein
VKEGYKERKLKARRPVGRNDRWEDGRTGQGKSEPKTSLLNTSLHYIKEIINKIKRNYSSGL